MIVALPELFSYPFLLFIGAITFGGLCSGWIPVSSRLYMNWGLSYSLYFTSISVTIVTVNNLWSP